MVRRTPDLSCLDTWQASAEAGGPAKSSCAKGLGGTTIKTTSGRSREQPCSCDVGAGTPLTPLVATPVVTRFFWGAGVAIALRA